MKQYLDALKQIMDRGVDRDGRNGLSRALFGMQMRYDMADGFPAVTTKKLAFKVMKAELFRLFESLLRCQRLPEVGLSHLGRECGGGLLETKGVGLKGISGEITVFSGGHGRHPTGKL